MAVTILALGLLVFLAHFFAVLFDRFRFPDVLPLMLLGLAAGPLLGWVSPSAFGRLGGVLSTVTLILILFEGGLGLKLATLKQSLWSGGRITLVGFAVTFVGVGWLSAPLLRLTFLEGMVLGAILAGTSSAVVLPLCSKLDLKPQTRTTLLLESTFTDVFGIVVTLGLLGAVRSASQDPWWFLAGRVLVSFVLAGVFGFAAALLWSSLLSRVRQLENNLFTTPAVAFIVFGITELFQYSGALGVLAFGITLGNLGHPDLRGLGHRLKLHSGRLNQMEQAVVGELVFLLKAFFFVYIGLSLHLGEPRILLLGLGITVFIFLVRLPVVKFTLPASLPPLDRAAARVMVPKGLAAAALASLAAGSGLSGGVVIQDAAYSVVIFSIAAASLAVAFLPRFFPATASARNVPNKKTVAALRKKK